MLSRLGERLRAYAEKDGRGYPDWAIRYGPIVRRIRRMHGGLPPIVEIGANENGLERFARCGPIVLDISAAHLRAARAAQGVRAVLADISTLPFPSGSLRTVVCVDTFEHIPEEKRPAAACEIVRVLHEQGVAVITFPSGAAALEAEKAVRAAYAAYTGGTISWLEEHAQEGLPDPAGIEQAFQEACHGRFRVVRRRNASAGIWRWTWRVLMCGWPGRANSAAQAMLRFITPLLTRAHFGPCYRSEIWLEPADR